MIVFDLKCTKDHVFEGWFRDSASHEAQAKAGEIVCPVCGDTGVSKAPMAPNLACGSNADAPSPEADRTALMLRQLNALRDHIEKTCDDVGERFPEEARKIHYGEIERRNIHGEASLDEAQDLREEGIEFGVVPRLPRHDS